MGNRLYVGNLPFSAGELDLQNHFASAGTVKNCRIMIDRETGRSRGFGFVTMATDEEAANAISALNGVDFIGRRLLVNEARERDPNAPRTSPSLSSGGGFKPRPSYQETPSFADPASFPAPTPDRNSRRKSFSGNSRRRGGGYGEYDE